MKCELRSITVTFSREGDTEISVAYAHAHELPAPGTKKRTATATEMARKGLEAALEDLGSGPVVWGGFGTDTRVSRDVVLVDRKEHAA